MKNDGSQKLIAESSYLPTSWRNGEHRSTLTAGMEEEEFRNAKAQAMDFERREKELASYVQELQRLPDDKLLDYVISSDLLNAETVGADALRKTYAEFSDKLKEKENLKSQNIGARHPKMLALLETERILGDKLNKELIGLRSSLKSKLEMVAASRKHWEATVAQKRKIFRSTSCRFPCMNRPAVIMTLRWTSLRNWTPDTRMRLPVCACPVRRLKCISCRPTLLRPTNRM